MRWKRAGKIAAIGVGAVLLSAILLVQVQQQVLRWRAERLLADIREIQMGKSNWADAQWLMHKWGEMGRVDGFMHCRILRIPDCPGGPVSRLSELLLEPGWSRNAITGACV